MFLFVRGFDHVYVGVDYFAKTIVFLYKIVKAIELITFLKDDFILFYLNRFAYLFKRGLSYNCNLKKNVIQSIALQSLARKLCKQSQKLQTIKSKLLIIQKSRGCLKIRNKLQGLKAIMKGD